MTAYCRHLTSWLDLRFGAKSEEATFKRSLEESLYLSTICFSALVVLGGLISGNDFLEELQRKDGKLNLTVMEPRTYCFFSILVSCVLYPFLVAAALLLGWRCRGVRSCLRLVDLECVAILLVVLPNVLVPLGNGWAAAVIFGKQAEDVWIKDMRGSDARVALVVDTINTCLCLFIPIRMCRKWIPALSGVISFSIYASKLSPQPDHGPTNIFMICALSCCALWGAWRNEADARQNFLAQRLVKKKSSENQIQKAGACRILDNFCDGLVELGPDFCIRDPNPRFAALLLCSNSQVLAGKNFCDYLSSDSDRQRFVSALQGDDDQNADTNKKMVQISLRSSVVGSTGRDFSVYVYHARIFDAGECGHMVAIVEAQERQPPSVCQMCGMKESASFLDVRPLEVCRVPSSRSDESSSSLAPSVEIPLDNVSEVAAWLDINSEDLTILKCSAGFTVFGPISEGSSFSSMVTKDANGFRKWFQRAVNFKMNACLDTEVEPCSLRLCTSPNACIEFTAKCKPHFGKLQDASDDYSDHDSDALCIVFSEVKAVKRKRPSHSWHLQQRSALVSNRACPSFSL